MIQRLGIMEEQSSVKDAENEKCVVLRIFAGNTVPPVGNVISCCRANNDHMLTLE
jgi:hypothetical protein